MSELTTRHPAGTRPYTREEVSTLFDHAADEVERIGKSTRRLPG